MARLTKNVKLLNKVVILDKEGRVLLLKRPLTATSRPGAWDLPGGNAEWPKTETNLTNPHLQDAAREVEEEAGLTVDPAIFTMARLVDALTYFDKEKGVYAIIFGWSIFMEELDSDTSQITLSDEHTESAWVTETELADYDFGEPVGTYLKDIITKALQRAHENKLRNH